MIRRRSSSGSSSAIVTSRAYSASPPLSAARCKNTYFSAKYKRIAARRGPKRAIVVERAMVIAAWNLLVNRDFYRDCITANTDRG
jgi:hypothetical protein